MLVLVAGYSRGEEYVGGVIMGWDGIGTLIGKVSEWLPGRRESKEGKIERLIDENAKLAQEYPLSAKAADRIGSNLDRIKRLREEIARIK